MATCCCCCWCYCYIFLNSKQSAKDRLFIYKQSRSRSMGGRKTASMFLIVFSGIRFLWSKKRLSGWDVNIANFVFKCCIFLDTCGPIRYLKFFDREQGLYMYLQGHTFLNLSIGASKSCETECLYRRECVAINIGPAINDMRVCELCNSDHIQHPNDLKRREGWTYKGTQVGRISLE